jgi:hypothetical protein
MNVHRRSRQQFIVAAMVACSLFAAIRSDIAAYGTEASNSADNVKRSKWKGFDRLDFQLDGREALLILPPKADVGKPWIWRTEFFGHEPHADIELLGKGFHIAYVNVQNLYGAPKAMDAMDAFYDHVTREYGLMPKVVLEGFSRGG